MEKSAGLWIDHREAVIVLVSPKGETTKIIRSNVEKQQGRIGGVRSPAPYEPLLVPADDRQQNSFKEHLNGYYDKVIAAIRDVRPVLIFGPGEARGELKKRIERSRSNKSVVEVEVAGKMTARQIAAKVRKHFLAKNKIFSGVLLVLLLSSPVFAMDFQARGISPLEQAELNALKAKENPALRGRWSPKAMYPASEASRVSDNLSQKILAGLRKEKSLKDAVILLNIRSFDGAVVLEGVVNDQAEKELIGHISMAAGAKSVKNHIKIKKTDRDFIR